MDATLFLKNIISFKDREGATAVLVERTTNRFCLMEFDAEYARYIGAAMMRQHTVVGVPMAHGAFLDILAAIGWKVDSVVVRGLESHHFLTELRITKDGQTVTRRISPFDCLAFAGYTRCPILIDDLLLSLMDSRVEDSLRRQLLTLLDVKSVNEAQAEEAAKNMSSSELPQA